MSLLPTVGDILNLRVYTYNPINSQLGINDYGYVIAAVGAILPPSWQDLCDGFDELLAPLMKACIGNACYYTGTQVECVEPAPYPMTVGSVGNRGFGTGGADIIPDQMAPIIRRRTDLRGPSQRGRTFMPFCPIDFLGAGGNLDVTLAGGAYYPLMQALYGTIVPGDTDVHGISVTGFLTGEVYTLLPSLIHRVPKPGVSTTSALSYVHLEELLGGLRKRGDWGRMNPEFQG